MPTLDKISAAMELLGRGIHGTSGMPPNVDGIPAWLSPSVTSKNSAVFRPFRGFRGKGGFRGNPRPGVTLLEAVVAIAIVGLTSVSALEAVGGDMRTTERARRAIEAEALSGTRLDFMDLLSDRELQALPDSVEKGKFAPPLDEYSWKTTSTPIGELGGVYDVRVTIDWPTGSYVVRTYQYRTPPLVTR